jgi:diguanylate cyclase (GGDEF)-like protein/PAS domain S-box-containing protein
MHATGLPTPVPPSLALERNPVLEDCSGLDLVVHEDRVALLASWDRVLTTGAARCLVHLVSRPEETVVVHGFDLREAHGVLLAVYVPTDPGDSPLLVARANEIAKALPRFATVEKDERSFITKVDEALPQILGWRAEEMEGRRSIEFVHPDDHTLAIGAWMEMLVSSSTARRIRQRLRRRDGSWVWFEVSNHNLLEDPDHPCVVSEMVDISEEMAAHELVDRLADAVPVGLFQIDASRRIVYTNDRLHRIIGIERASTVEAQLNMVVPADWPAVDRALGEVLNEGASADVEVELCVGAGRELRFCTISLRALDDNDGTISGAIACVADVTDSTRMREELERQATFDELTGCYNRASIMRALEGNLASGQRQAERAVMFIDVDHFKQINDREGHAAGDELLRVVAGRLQGSVRQGDLVGRIGGDEFLVVCPDVDGPDQAMSLAKRLARALHEGRSSATGSTAPQVSIGVAWSKGHGTDADTLVARADGAMYESKREGAGQPRFASDLTAA